MKSVYLDNAATTMLKPEVVEAMLPYYMEGFGNPSSVHAHGRRAKRGLDQARLQIVQALHAKYTDEIIFTAGGSESNNAVLRSVAKGKGQKGGHVITTAVEHHAILNTCEYLEKTTGLEVTYLPVDEYGMVTAKQVCDAMREDTVLVSVMFANNEVGTLMPIAQIGALCREKKVLFHTDAVQAVGHVAINVEELNVDFLSLSAHKFHGPKGVGALYIRRGVPFTPLILGGQQEHNRRAGTENVPGIVGMGAAVSLAMEHMEQANERICKMRDKLVLGIVNNISNAKLNGHPGYRLPANANIMLPGVSGERLLMLLDRNGVSVSSGAACASGSLDPSHVLLAMGLSQEQARSSIRMTLSDMTTDEEIDYVLQILPSLAEQLRMH